MSTFGGLLEEIKDISIDRFDGDNVQSKVFFLSHCHTDHMVGLRDHSNGLPGPLYVSPVTAVIVGRLFPCIKDVRCLAIGTPTEIAIVSTDNCRVVVVVTAIPAGHCPGSVMFLFEQNEQKILYTGDIRLTRASIKDITALKQFHKATVLDAAYIDSTFLSTSYSKFPLQKASNDAVVRLIQEWLNKDQSNVVAIRPPARYGYEFMLQSIAEQCSQKIHVAQDTFHDYQYMPTFDGFFRHDEPRLNERIHLCSSVDAKYRWDSQSLACQPMVEAKNIRIIRPTAMRWQGYQNDDSIVSEHEHIPNIYYVCYSNHSSYTELVDLLEYLQPKTVRLNVLPADNDKRKSMHDCLKDILKKHQSNCSSNTGGNRQIETEAFSFMNIPIVDDDGHSQVRKYAGDKDLIVKRPKLQKRTL